MSYAEIQNIVTALERPLTNERTEELNQKIKTYLEDAQASQRVLNLSFWQTVRYQYWSFMNLTLLIGSKFDVEHGAVMKKFENQIREMQRLRLISDTPKVARHMVQPIKPAFQYTSQNISQDQPRIYQPAEPLEVCGITSTPQPNKSNTSLDNIAANKSDAPPDNIDDDLGAPRPPDNMSNPSHSNIPIILGCSCIIGLIAWYAFRNFNTSSTQ